MIYSTGHSIRLIGGRLVLDFINTADWSHDGQVVDEKIASEADLKNWLGALGMNGVLFEPTMSKLHSYRFELRRLFTGSGDSTVLNMAREIEIAADTPVESIISGQRLQSLLAISAISILADRRECDRLKVCPAENCGWLFIDETKNARRTWCSMETCGNRAKAARHYARTKASAS